MTTDKSHHTCGLCGSRGRGIFCSLTEAELRETETTRAMKCFERGQTLFLEGRPAGTIYCIHSGLVKLTQLSVDGEQLAVRLLGPGDVAGYRDVLADSPYSASAVALMPSHVCAIPRDTFGRLVSQTPSLALDLLAELARQLRHRDKQVAVAGVGPVRRRAAQLLVQLWETAENNGPVRTITAPIMRSEMSQIIGTTPETFSRTLKTLAEEGAVEIGRRLLQVRDPEALRRIAAGEETIVREAE